MLKVLQKMNEEKQQRDYLEEMQHVARAKNWNHVADILQKVAVSAHQPSYRLFWIPFGIRFAGFFSVNCTIFIKIRSFR